MTRNKMSRIAQLLIPLLGKCDPARRAGYAIWACRAWRDRRNSMLITLIPKVYNIHPYNGFARIF